MPPETEPLIDTPDAPPPAKFAKNREELAKVLGGYEVKTISRWLKIAGNPGRRPDNLYDIEAWKEWVDKNGRRHAPKEKETKLDFETRMASIKHRQMQIELAKTEGQMLDIDEACGVFEALFGEFTQRLKALRHEISPALAGETPAEINKRLGEAHDRLLGLMSLGDQAKKKVFWRIVSEKLCDLQRKLLPSTGPLPS